MPPCILMTFFFFLFWLGDGGAVRNKLVGDPRQLHTSSYKLVL